MHSTSYAVEACYGTPHTAHKPRVNAGEAVHVAQIVNHHGRRVAQAEPVVINTDAPTSSKSYGPAGIPILVNQNTKSTDFSFNHTTQNTLTDHFTHNASLIQLLGKKVIDTVQWAATVALANQYRKSQGHGPLNLTNELSHTVHRNLSYGSIGTTRAH
jgi:hypothetical protein